MASDCKKFSEKLVDLALGIENEAREHVQSCTNCAAELKKLEKLVSNLVVPVRNAPPSVISDAQSISLPKRRMMSVVANSLAGAGARLAETESFQLIFEEGERRLRAMYTKVSNGWDVMGQMQGGAGMRVLAADRITVIDGFGRFSFVAPTLADTEMVILGPNFTLCAPSAQEVSAGGIQ